MRQNGFTLIELAIALMVIGLLIGGVLKGQELIENAKIIAYTKQFKDYDAAVMIFRNTYGSLPGDLRNPGTRVPDCTGVCATISSTHGSGTLNLELEYTQFWFQLGRAGLIRNVNYASTGALAHVTASPPTPYDGNIRIGGLNIVADFPGNSYQVAEPGTASNAYIKLNRIIALDNKMDDGMAKTGSIRSLVHMYITDCSSSTTNDYNRSLPMTTDCDVAIQSMSMN